MKTVLLFALTISLTDLHAQYHYLGSAQPLDNQCVLLTPDEPYSEGIAYNTNTIDLGSDFVIDFDIYLGDKDEGADGITFVMHTDPRGFQAYGTYGECMGYGRWNPEYAYGSYIAPSLAIEFDTYYNPTQNDPENDHMAYLENGTNYHFVDVKKPVEPGNLEDDRLHSFILRWDSSGKTLRVWLDDVLRVEITKDLLNKVFSGNTNVIWGFTASTGRKHNLQYFCLKRFAYLPNTKPEHLAFGSGFY
ncbi:MAG: lectin [Cytophagales bacterium]|nr:lectin [Cytophagales bacterium]